MARARRGSTEKVTWYSRRYAWAPYVGAPVGLVRRQPRGRVPVAIGLGRRAVQASSSEQGRLASWAAPSVVELWARCARRGERDGRGRSAPPELVFWPEHDKLELPPVLRGRSSRALANHAPRAGPRSLNVGHVPGAPALSWSQPMRSTSAQAGQNCVPGVAGSGRRTLTPQMANARRGRTPARQHNGPGAGQGWSPGSIRPPG